MTSDIFTFFVTTTDMQPFFSPLLNKARNNFLQSRQDVSALLALRNLEELLMGGKQPNTIYSNVVDIIYIFESCEKVQTIDGRSKSSWMAELKGVESSPLPAPISTPTPRFDHVARLWQNRLIKEADEQRVEDTQKILRANAQERLEELQRIEKEHEEEKDRVVSMCRGLRALSLQAHNRKAERYRDECNIKLSAAISKEKNNFEDKLRQFNLEIEEGKRAIRDLQGVSTHQEQEERHKSEAQKKKISGLEKQLLVLKTDVAVLTARNTALASDERLALASDKLAESATVLQLQDRIRSMEQEKASDAAELTMALRDRGEEHRLLKEAHLKLQRKAEKAVTRLNSVHDAFLKSTEQNSQLVRDLEDMERDREARERTIEELGSCVRHLKAALRKLSHALSVSQKEAEKEEAVVGTRREDVGRSHRIEVEKNPEGGSNRHINADHCSGSEEDSDSLRASAHLNESTDFLNRISFNGKDGLDEGSVAADKGIENMRRNAGRRTRSGADGESQSPLGSMACSAEYHTGCTGEEAAIDPQSPRDDNKCKGRGESGADSKYAKLALKLDSLDKELRQRVTDLMLAGVLRFYATLCFESMYCHTSHTAQHTKHPFMT
jgi:hypothetical protein